MKIESLKCITYDKCATTLCAVVKASTTLSVTNALVGKEQLRIFTDNEEKEQLVETLEGYQHLRLLSDLGDGVFEVYLANAPLTLEEVITATKKEIEDYDKSEAVNSFSLADKRMWLDKATRVGLMNSIGIEKSAGKTTTTLWFDGVRYDIPIALALPMLNALELYALDCYNVTQGHIAAVSALQTIEEVQGYDYVAGYPQKLVFNLNADIS